MEFKKRDMHVFKKTLASRRGAASGSEQARRRSPNPNGWISGPDARASPPPLAAPLHRWCDMGKTPTAR